MSFRNTKVLAAAAVDLVGTFNGRVPIGIRGISSNANEATVGLASGVAIMIDGVPAAGIREKSGKFSATLFVNNLTDHHYFVDMEDFWSGPWGANAVSRILT